MKQIADHLYSRGKAGNLYCRVRIPQKLLKAYPRKGEIVRALGTSDVREGKRLLVTELASIYQEFSIKEKKLAIQAAQRAERSAQRLTTLTDEQVNSIASNWVHQALLGDDYVRSQGLDDEDFDNLDAQLHEQRKELGRMLSQGRVEKILPAMHGFLHLLGTEVSLEPEQERRVGYKFLEAVVQTLDIRLDRQQGRVKPTATLTPRQSIQDLKSALAPAKSAPSWDEVFNKWNHFVANRPKPTLIAAQTPWRELERVAKAAGIRHPGQVTRELVNRFVEGMEERGLSTETINDRLAKVRAIYKVAVGKLLLSENPAKDVIGRGKSGLDRRRKKRLPFSDADLQTIFSCSVYNDFQERSRGSLKEATYWIPLLMYYTGARTEEVAGLALEDLVRDDALDCWFLNIIDRPEPDDADLFDDASDEDGVKSAHARTLKNAASIRKVPVAQELLDLGLLQYVEWVRAQGAKALFPTLKKDFHEKLSGSFSKFFGRLKKKLGIDDERKVLYSFRHTFKDTLNRAEMPSRYMKRVMGHTSGDGEVSDSYGSDLPFVVLVRHFKTVKFHPIPAKPWQPGKGIVQFPHLRETTTTKRRQSARA